MRKGRTMSDSARSAKKRLPLSTILGYGVGDIFGGGSTTTINMFYLYFLVDVVGLRPGLAGTLILLSKTWDAVTDPFMGLISDNTRTRLGRRRPYFLAGIFLIVLSFTWMWSMPPFSGEIGRFLVALASYLVFSTVYTIVWVPYNAIAAELTADYDERTRLSTARIIFSNLAGITCAMTATDVFVNGLYPDNAARGFLVMAFVFSLFYALPYIATIRTCRENPEYMSAPKRTVEHPITYLKQQLTEPFRLRPFRGVAMMYLFGFMVTDSVMAMAIYYIQYYLGGSSMFTLLVPVYAGMLTVMPLVGLLSKRVGKRETYLIAGGVWLTAFAILPFIGPGDMHLVPIFGALFGCAAAAVQVMVFAMFPDIPDADEFFSGVRREGTFSGIFAFLRKGGSAVTIFLIGNAMQWIGYKQPVEQLVDGVIVSVPQVQDAAFATRLLVIFVGIPIFFALIAIVAALRYPLTRTRLHHLKQVVAWRRGEAGDQPLTDAQIEELGLSLGGVSAGAMRSHRITGGNERRRL